MTPPASHDRPSVLVTGFGPFPGVPRNASALLVQALAHDDLERRLGVRLVRAILPTEWRAGLHKLDALWNIHAPSIAIHFGVTADAEGFAVETTARNACLPAHDACGAMPDALVHEHDGPECRASTLPVQGIVARLREAGLPGCLSHDAGTYLCNAAIYASLCHAARADASAMAGFVHIPSCLAVDRETTASPGPSCPLDWHQARLGAALILEACVDHLRAGARTSDSANAAFVHAELGRRSGLAR